MQDQEQSHTTSSFHLCVSVKNMVNLFDYSLSQLQEYFLSIDEQKFRAIQVFRWIHVYGIINFDDMTDIAKSLKTKLKTVTIIKAPTIIKEIIANDGVYKWIIDLGNNNQIETIFIPEDNRGTLCISSQVGCALECTFCSTGRQGFNRNLTTGEIISQIWLANKQLGYFDNKSNNRIITNVVLMGMGEPLANYHNVINAINIMLDNNAYSLSKRKVTLSTSGIIPKIIQLANDCPISLAVSLHASNDDIRSQIIPLNIKYPIKDLIAACKIYLLKSAKDYVTFEYVMLDNVNDKFEHARELIEQVKNINCKFNLIPFNSFPNSGYKSSSMSHIIQFQKILQQADIVTTIRKTRGEKIDAACGQLVGNVLDKTKRAQKWNIVQI